MEKAGGKFTPQIFKKQWQAFLALQGGQNGQTTSVTKGSRATPEV